MHRQHIEKKTCRALMIPKLAATAMSSDSDEFAEGGLVVHRVRTSLPETVSEEDREKFECVVSISPGLPRGSLGRDHTESLQPMLRGVVTRKLVVTTQGGVVTTLARGL